MGAASRKRSVLLWGASGAGKSSLLAASLGAGERPGPLGVDPERTPTWVTGDAARLASGRPVLPTRVPVQEAELAGPAGTRVIVRDPGDGLGDGAPGEEALEVLNAADRAILVFEAHGRDLEARAEALHMAARVLVPRPAVILVTKLDQLLGWDDPAWGGGPGWWRDLGELAPWVEGMLPHDYPVLPASAFGYDPASRRPAVLLGEYGEALPYRVAPRGIQAALAELLEAA